MPALLRFHAFTHAILPAAAAEALMATPTAAHLLPVEAEVQEHTVFAPTAFCLCAFESVSASRSSSSQIRVPPSVVALTGPTSLIRTDTTISPFAVSTTVTLGLSVVFVAPVGLPSAVW